MPALRQKETISLGKGAAAMSEPKTYTLEAPGAVLHYDVRETAARGIRSCCSSGRRWEPPASPPWLSSSPTARW